jgi:hypothetical protein
MSVALKSVCSEKFILSSIRDAFRAQDRTCVRKYNTVLTLTVRISGDLPELFVKNNVLDCRMTLAQLIRFLDGIDPNK